MTSQNGMLNPTKHLSFLNIQITNIHYKTPITTNLAPSKLKLTLVSNGPTSLPSHLHLKSLAFYASFCLDGEARWFSWLPGCFLTGFFLGTFTLGCLTPESHLFSMHVFTSSLALFLHGFKYEGEGICPSVYVYSHLFSPRFLDHGGVSHQLLSWTCGPLMSVSVLLLNLVLWVI